jgi:hypothetical protein
MADDRELHRGQIFLRNAHGSTNLSFWKRFSQKKVFILDVNPISCVTGLELRQRWDSPAKSPGRKMTPFIDLLKELDRTLESMY